MKSVILPATGEHSETYFEVVTDPTCSAAGSRNEICSVCFTVINTEVIEPIAHTIVHVEAKAATDCQTWDGNVEYWYCSVCGAAWLDEARTQVTNLMSVKANGAHSYFYPCDVVCMVCGEETNTEATHTIVHVEAKAATDCQTWDGNVEYWYCSVCGYAWLDEALTQVTNRNSVATKAECNWLFTGYDEYNMPTCDIEGIANYECIACGETKQETVLHRFLSPVGNVEGQGPTCTEYGYAIFECVWCTEQETRLVAPEHDYEVTASLNATCTEGGSRTFTCSICGDSYTEEIPANGHNQKWQYDSTTATCTEAGVEIYGCYNCDAIIEVEVEAYGHEWEIDDSSLNLEAHTINRVCSVCDATEAISSLGMMADPFTFSVSGEITVNANTDYTYYKIVLPEGVTEGYLTVTFNSDNVYYYLVEANGLYATQYSYVEKFEIQSDGAYLLGISTNWGEEELVVTATFEEAIVPEMGEVPEKPIVMEGVNYGYTSTGKVWYKLQELMPGNVTITVEGDAVVKYCIYEYGMTVTEDMLTTYTDTFVNEYYADYYFLVESEEEVTFVVNVEAPKGSLDNPLVIVTGDNAVSVSGQSWPPFYAVYQSGVNGTLTLTFESATAQIYYGTHPYQMQTPVTNGTTIEITAWTTYYFGITTEDFMPASFTITAAFEEAAGPEMPEPDGDIGEIIGSMEVETTDTYGYHDMFTYTAENAGKYTFAVPVGLGFYSKAQYDVYGWAEIDFNSANGGYVTVELAAGEEYSFYVGSLTKDYWTIDVYYLAPAHVHTEVEIPAQMPLPSNGHIGYTAGVKCSDCGEVLVAQQMFEVTATPDYKIFGVGAASLAITENISVNFKVNVPANYKNYYMVFVFEGGEYVVTDNYLEASSGRYVFNFDKTRPQLMNSLITAYAYGESEDGYMMDVYDYSIKTYCVNTLKKDETTAELRTAISDLIVYGALTQKYIDENVDEADLITTIIANEGYTITPSTYNGIDENSSAQYIDVDTEDGLTWKSSTVAMGSSTQVVFKFVADDITNLQIKVELGDKEIIIDASELEYVNSRYEVRVDFITSLEYSDTVTATFIKDGVESDSVSDTINNYLGRNVAKYENTVTGDLMKAVYLFGTSVTAYFDTAK